MTIRTCFRGAWAITVLALGLLAFTPGTASAVANLDITVTDQGQPVKGSSISLTFPDGTSVTRDDDDNDGRIGLMLGDPGTYRLTIMTPDGRTSSTTFTGPRDGTVTVALDRPGATPRVSVRDTSSTASNGQPNDFATDPFSVGFYGNYGQSSWATSVDDGNDVFPGEDAKIAKAGIGFELRYYVAAATAIFIANRFFYHIKQRSDEHGFINETDAQVELSERWKNQMVLGWHFLNRPDVLLTVMAGIQLARIQLLTFPFFSDLFDARKVMISPLIGAEAEFLISPAARLWWVFGFTLAFMNTIHLEAFNDIYRANGGVQWDIHTGLRVPF